MEGFRETDRIRIYILLAVILIAQSWTMQSHTKYAWIPVAFVGWATLVATLCGWWKK